MRAPVFLKIMSMVAVGGTLMTSSCLTDNFWAGKWSEIVNLGILSAINLALGAATNGVVQL